MIAGTANSSIPDSVTAIARAAFAEPNGIGEWLQEMGLDDIAYPQFTSIQIPDGVTSVGDSAFAGCTALAEVVVPDSVTTIGSYAFRDCTSLATLAVPESVISIGGGAFDGTQVAIDYAGSRAQWEAIAGSGSGAVPISYGLVNVTFETNGGSEVLMQDVAAGGTATVPDLAPTKQWCEFDGWYADAALETPFDFDNTEITADTTVYAKWIEMCTVTFDANGGSAVEAQHVWPGEKATAPEPEPVKEAWICRL